jgi:hypothetical protein
MAQHSEQMAQRGTQIASIMLNRAGATASRKMIVKELGDNCFVDASDAQTATVKPLRKVGKAAHAVGKRGRSVAAISQVLLIRIYVRCERPFGEPVYAGGSR